MRKITKTVMAFLTAMTMTASAMSVTAYAEENADNIVAVSDKTAERYTLEQLFEMSDEDFFSLQGKNCSGKDYYDSIYSHATQKYEGAKYYGLSGLSGVIYRYVNDSNLEDGYQKDVTEEAIKSVLGDTVKYTICSPSFEDNMYYSYELSVYFPDYVTYESISEDDQRIMEFAKCWYCADQVFEFDYYGNGMVGGGEGCSDISTLKGDADLNMEFDLADITTVAKYTLSHESYPLKNEIAYANADMNFDGTVDGLDTSALIERQLGK